MHFRLFFDSLKIFFTTLVILGQIFYERLPGREHTHEYESFRLISLDFMGIWNGQKMWFHTLDLKGILVIAYKTWTKSIWKLKFWLFSQWSWPMENNSRIFSDMPWYGCDFSWNDSNRKKPHMVFPRPLLIKLLQEVIKFNDICVSWSSPKIDLETKNYMNQYELFTYLTLYLLAYLFLLLALETSL